MEKSHETSNISSTPAGRSWVVLLAGQPEEGTVCARPLFSFCSVPPRFAHAVYRFFIFSANGRLGAPSPRTFEGGQSEGIQMAGRNRAPPQALKGGPRGVAPYNRGPGPLPPHPALVEDMREGPYGRGPLPPHPALLEEKLAAQHQEIQALLVENQRLAATHVALRQELAAAQQGLQHMNHVASDMQAEKDHQLREVYEKSMKLEADLRSSEPLKAELMQLRADAQKLSAARQELNAQVQALTQDLARARADLQQVPAMRSEIDGLHQELQRARAAIEYEKKAHADQLEQSQAMEKNLISMAREVEKLRAELANADKRGRAAANPGPGYGGNYGNSEIGYAGGPYGDGYGIHPVQGGPEGGAQYGAGGGASWGAYDMQRPHVRR